MKKIVYILVLLHAVAALAQKQTNIWYFGGNAGLDFNSGTPVPLNNGQVNTSEGSSSIADENGNLLFYTEGVTVYNKNHQVMQNGEGLLGHQSCSQSAFIVGKPGSNTIYYIFTVGAIENPVGLHYSEVDMAANNGLGAVTANKNINLLDNTTEGIAATLHSNGTDIWVLVHRFPGNAWYSYLVTANGVNPEPVISNAGPVYEVYTEWASPTDETGCLKIAPQGNRVAIASQGKGITVFDYDKSTGAVSNAVQLSAGGFWSGPYGVEFSPSGKLLYGSRMGILTQYNLEAADVAASGITLMDDPFFAWGAMQLASNGKLYKSEGFQDYISVIHNPDVIGTGCNLQPYGVYLGGQGYSNLGLPNAMASFFVKPDFEVQSLCLGSPSEFTFLWNRVPGSVLWDFGDGATSTQLNPVHTYAAAGTYTVKLTVTLSAATWVTERQVTVAESPRFTLGGPYETCVPASITLMAQAQNFDPALATYLWELNGQPVGNAATLQPQEFGAYTLTVTVNGCAATQSVEVTGINIATTFSGGCNGNSYTLEAAPVNVSFNADTANYSWQGPDGFSANGQQAVITDEGSYTLTITTAEGCTITHTWEVTDAGCEEPKVPKGVSPNGDGLNDVFDLTLHDVARLDIFNRYGLQVFSQEHYTTQWHGQTAGGHELPDGTYYYRILKHNGLNVTGWVYVNRENP